MFLYTYLQGGTNNGSTKKSQIQTAATRMNTVLYEEAQESAAYRADYLVKCITWKSGDTNTTDNISVGAFASTGRDFGSVRQSAINAGFNRVEDKYTIFADFSNPSGYAGMADVKDDNRKVTDNQNNGVVTMHAVVYDPYWDTRIPMHENGHNMGAVQLAAPDSNGTWHCRDGLDVMCQDDGDGTYRSDICTDKMHFDCRHQTYFHPTPPSWWWLATHWNIGWSGNRFVYVRQ